MVKNVWVSVFYVYVLTGTFYAIGVNKYQLKKATHHVINQFSKSPGHWIKGLDAQ